MNKHNSFFFLREIDKKINYLNDSLEKKKYQSKENLLHEALNIKEYYETNVSDFRNSEDPNLLALQTALGDIDSVFEELILEIKKI